jgi:hypothetical protein
MVVWSTIMRQKYQSLRISWKGIAPIVESLSKVPYGEENY